MPGCKHISVPKEPTKGEILVDLKQKIKDGIYNIGHLIVPQRFEKLTFNGFEIEKEFVITEGRKIDLFDIRKKLLKKHEKYMRIRTDDDFDKLERKSVIHQLNAINELNPNYKDLETVNLLTTLKMYERTRNIMTWHDGSPLGGHSYLLFMVAVMYDSAVFLTDQEYQEKSSISINVQSIIEKPQLYILARCPSNEQQILYSEERMLDISMLTSPIISSNSVEINDQLRIFKGDKPAAQFEAGQQKGGRFFCFNCSIQDESVVSAVHASKLPHLSLSDRLNHLLSTSGSINRSKKFNLKIYDHLNKDSISEELRQRNVKYYSHFSTKDLQKLLENEMHGIQRVPALMYKNPTESLSNLNLSKYEILFTEPLHDISNHIKNIYQELPWHFEKESKKEIKEIVHGSFQGKEARNAADYRRSLLKVTQYLLLNFPEHFMTIILITMCEIQKIIYSPRKIIKICKKYYVYTQLLLNMHKKLRNI